MAGYRGKTNQEYQREYYLKNREHRLNNMKDYYLNNREYLLIYSNEYNKNRRINKLNKYKDSKVDIVSNTFIISILED
jgi:hypothetical protein